MRITARNRGPETATLHVLPTLWFRNEWSWNPGPTKPELRAGPDGRSILASHPELGDYALDIGPGPDGTQPTLLFCENETNLARIDGVSSITPYPKDGINDHVVGGARRSTRTGVGTKASPWYRLDVPPGETAELRLRLHKLPKDASAGTTAPRSRPPTARAATARPQRRTSSPSIRSGRRSSRRCSGARPRRMSSTRPSVAKAGPTTSNGSCVRRSPGCSGASSTTATTSRAGSMATRDCRRPHRSGRRPECGLAALRGRRHPVDARPMGVPVVRGVGPRLPRGHARPHRSGLREVSAAAHVPRMVPAPGRGAARLRVVVRRREPAGPRRGRLSRLRDRRPPRLPVPAPDLPQAADQLHLVAQPPGQGGQRPLLGRLPRASTTSARSTGRTCRPAPSSSSRTRPPGCSSTA